MMINSDGWKFFSKLEFCGMGCCDLVETVFLRRFKACVIKKDYCIQEVTVFIVEVE